MPERLLIEVRGPKQPITHVERTSNTSAMVLCLTGWSCDASCDNLCGAGAESSRDSVRFLLVPDVGSVSARSLGGVARPSCCDIVGSDGVTRGGE